MIADMVVQMGKIGLFASLLIALLLVLTPLLQKRYRARWRYFAWLVIALRLLVPVNLSLPRAPIQIELPQQQTTVVMPASDGQTGVPVDLPQEQAPATDAPAPLAPVEPTPSAASGIEPMRLAGMIWAAGTAAFLLFQLASYQVFLHKLNRTRREETPQEIKETLWHIGVDMGICRLPEAVITDAIDAPVLIGVVRPRVLLPHTEYSKEEIAFILRHELVHYRRRDMWYKLVLLLANAVHWFNPLVYIMTVQAAKDIELACDDDVAKELDREARARYGETILAALPAKRRLEPVFSTHFGSTKQNIKSRLRNLFDGAVKRRGIAALCVFGLCAVTATGLVTVGFASEKTGAPALAGETLSFSVPSIAPGEVVCVGKIELGPNASYSGSYSVESGGESMLGLHSRSDIDKSSGILWEQAFGGTASSIWFSSNKTRTLYVYVGSRNENGPSLTGVSGRLVRSGQGSGAPAEPLAPIANAMIRANDLSGQWAAANSVEGDTWQKQIDQEIRWIEDVYKEHKTGFVITETLPKAEAYNTDRARYLYDHSEIFRTMSTMQNGVFQVEDGSAFSGFSDFHTADMIQRTAVMVEQDGALNVDASYALTAGKMELWIIDPDGKRVYWNDSTASFSQSFTVSGPKGLWSVITVREGAAGGVVEGSVSIRLSQGQSTQSLHSSAKTDAFTVQRLGQATFQSGDGLDANLSWTGSGTLLLLYTDRAYNDDELLAPLQGLPGIPEPDWSKVDQEKMSGTFNFSQTPTAPLQWSSSPNPGTYHVYLLHLGETGTVSGAVQVKNAGVTIDLLPNAKTSGTQSAFQLSSGGGRSITQSSSFTAEAGQKLTISVASSIQGGSVDLFLFSPAGKEHRYTFTGQNATEMLELSAGTWSYNCTGFFEGGDISIVGTRSAV